MVLFRKTSTLSILGRIKIMNSSQWQSYASISLFVFIWGISGIFTRIGLDYISVFPLLLFRFITAIILLYAISRIFKTPFLPPKGQRLFIASTGIFLIGIYSTSYFLAMDFGLTPGLLATIFGIQPILTLLLSERRFPPLRLIGLLISFTGLTLVVSRSMMQAEISFMGMLFAFLGLFSITAGTLMQKRITLSPHEVLPLQYLVSIALFLIILPWMPIRFELNPSSISAGLWLGIIVSVVAQLLLYRLIAGGNLVNVTSLFYLVPIVTALFDYLLLGNKMPLLTIIGLITILMGLAIVLRSAKRQIKMDQ